jgi:hypothetical protein
LTDGVFASAASEALQVLEVRLGQLINDTILSFADFPLLLFFRSRLLPGAQGGLSFAARTDGAVA